MVKNQSLLVIDYQLLLKLWLNWNWIFRNLINLFFNFQFWFWFVFWELWLILRQQLNLFLVQVSQDIRISYRLRKWEINNVIVKFKFILKPQGVVIISSFFLFLFFFWVYVVFLRRRFLDTSILFRIFLVRVCSSRDDIFLSSGHICLDILTAPIFRLVC
mgnify:CR=1 FL=1